MNLSKAGHALGHVPQFRAAGDGNNPPRMGAVTGPDARAEGTEPEKAAGKPVRADSRKGGKKGLFLPCRVYLHFLPYRVYFIHIPYRG